MKLTIIRAGISYFGIVFAAGVVLGIIRQLWAVPQFGTRMAELIEMPFMLVVIIVATHWIIQRFAIPAVASQRVGVGMLALGCLIAAELALAGIGRMTVVDYIAGRDPVSGSAYLIMLVIYALMPLWVMRDARSG